MMCVKHMVVNGDAAHYITLEHRSCTYFLQPLLFTIITTIAIATTNDINSSNSRYKEHQNVYHHRCLLEELQVLMVVIKKMMMKMNNQDMICQKFQWSIGQGHERGAGRLVEKHLREGDDIGLGVQQKIPDRLPGGCDMSQVLAATGKHLYPKFILQQPDLLADPGLRGVQAFRRGPRRLTIQTIRDESRLSR